MSTGDGAMCEFPDADAAVLAACEMQARVQQIQSRQGRNISIRIGLHCGPPLTAGVTAQRMAVMAASGQIITNGETKVLLSVQQSNAIRQHVLPARAKQETVTLYEVLWQPDHDRTQMPGSPTPIVQEVAGPAPAADPCRPRNRRRNLDLHGAARRPRHRAPASYGFARPRAHRSPKDKFVLVDHSSHGTFLRLNNGYEHKVWRSEMILRGSGVLSFALRASEKGAELVSFWCESVAAAAPPRAARAGGKRK